MAKTVWKFPAPHGLGIPQGVAAKYGMFNLRVPKGAEFLSVGIQNGRVVLWARVDPYADTEERVVLLTGTDNDAPEDGEFIGTYQRDWFVGHVFVGPALNK